MSTRYQLFSPGSVRFLVGFARLPLGRISPDRHVREFARSHGHTRGLESARVHFSFNLANHAGSPARTLGSAILEHTAHTWHWFTAREHLAYHSVRTAAAAYWVFHHLIGMEPPEDHGCPHTPEELGWSADWPALLGLLGPEAAEEPEAVLRSRCHALEELLHAQAVLRLVAELLESEGKSLGAYYLESASNSINTALPLVAHHEACQD